MTLFVPQRVEWEEILDHRSTLDPAVERSLRDLRRFNSLAGGRRVYRKLFRAIAGASSSLTVLDLGTGTSDLVGSLGTRVQMPIGLDTQVQHLTYGRSLERDGVRRIAGDALSLPLKDRSVDLVTSSHFFHHFTPEENVGLLNESLRVSRIGVMVTDTRRHRAPLLFVHLLGFLGLIGPITRHDAPASVRQGYTPEEALAIARETEASRFELMRMVPYRFGLLLWP